MSSRARSNKRANRGLPKTFVPQDIDSSDSDQDNDGERGMSKPEKAEGQRPRPPLARSRSRPKPGKAASPPMLQVERDGSLDDSFSSESEFTSEDGDSYQSSEDPEDAWPKSLRPTRATMRPVPSGPSRRNRYGRPGSVSSDTENSGNEGRGITYSEYIRGDPGSTMDVDGTTSDDDLFVIEEIRAHVATAKKIQYLVKWQSYSSDDNTWEPEENIMDFDVLNKYWKKQGGKSARDRAKKGLTYKSPAVLESEKRRKENKTRSKVRGAEEAQAVASSSGA